MGAYAAGDERGWPAGFGGSLDFLDEADRFQPRLRSLAV